VNVAGCSIQIIDQFIVSSYCSGYTGNGGSLPVVNVSFPILGNWSGSDNTGSTFNDLAAAAGGTYDIRYNLMAQALANFKNPVMSVRIGWGVNGTSYPWCSGGATQNGATTYNVTAANYVAAFKRIAQILKAAMPAIKIEWCLAFNGADPTSWWPGAYNGGSNPGGADVVSIQCYQSVVSHTLTGDNVSAWSDATGATRGITFAQTWASNNSVKFALSEWGAGSVAQLTNGTGGDGGGLGQNDGTWTQAAISYINGLSAGFFLYSLWSNLSPADDIFTPSANPSEQSAWISSWRNTTFGGSNASWWTGTFPPA
jgi:hypothetical protein